MDSSDMVRVRQMVSDNDKMLRVVAKRDLKIEQLKKKIQNLQLQLKNKSLEKITAPSSVDQTVQVQVQVRDIETSTTNPEIFQCESFTQTDYYLIEEVVKAEILPKVELKEEEIQIEKHEKNETVHDCDSVPDEPKKVVSEPRVKTKHKLDKKWQEPEKIQTPALAKKKIERKISFFRKVPKRQTKKRNPNVAFVAKSWITSDLPGSGAQKTSSLPTLFMPPTLILKNNFVPKNVIELGPKAIAVPEIRKSQTKSIFNLHNLSQYTSTSRPISSTTAPSSASGPISSTTAPTSTTSIVPMTKKRRKTKLFESSSSEEEDNIQDIEQEIPCKKKLKLVSSSEKTKISPSRKMSRNRKETENVTTIGNLSPVKTNSQVIENSSSPLNCDTDIVTRPPVNSGVRTNSTDEGKEATTKTIQKIEPEILPEMIPLGAKNMTKKFPQKPFEIEAVKKALEARRVKPTTKTTVTRPPTNPTVQGLATKSPVKKFGRLPASLTQQEEPQQQQSQQQQSQQQQVEVVVRPKPRVLLQKRTTLFNQARRLAVQKNMPFNSALKLELATKGRNDNLKATELEVNPVAANGDIVVSESNINQCKKNTSDENKPNECDKTTRVPSLDDDLELSSDDSEEPEKVASNGQKVKNDTEILEVQKSPEKEVQKLERVQKKPGEELEEKQAMQIGKDLDVPEIDKEEILELKAVEECGPILRTEELAIEESRETEKQEINEAKKNLFKFSRDNHENLSFLEEMHKRYETDHEMKSKVIEKRKEGMEWTDLRESHVNTVRIQLKRLMEPLNANEYENIVKQLTKPEFAGIHQRCLFDCIFVHIRQEKLSEQSFVKTSEVFRGEKVSLLTPKQMKIVTLLMTLSCTEMLKDILDRFKHYLFFSIFSSSRLYNMKGYVANNVIRFYLTLLRMTGDEDRAKMFLYDIFFFKSPRNHIFICILLDVWPDVLRWKGFRSLNQEQSGILDPIVDAIIWMIFNSGPPTSLEDLRVHESKNRLREQCNVLNPRISELELVKKWIGQVKNDPKNETLLNSTSKSLVLISKHKEYRWTHNNISNILVEMLITNESLRNWTIDTLALISRIYPVESREELTKIFSGAKGRLMSSVDPETENVSLRALVRLGHHLQAQTCMCLSEWFPNFPLSEETHEIVKTFLGTRASKHAKITIFNQKKKHLFAKKPQKNLNCAKNKKRNNKNKKRKKKVNPSDP